MAREAKVPNNCYAACEFSGSCHGAGVESSQMIAVGAPVGQGSNNRVLFKGGNSNAMGAIKRNEMRKEKIK